MRKLHSLCLLAVALVCFPWKAQATTPFTEGFESSSLPDTWSTIHVSGSPSWQTVRNNYYVSPHSGDYSAMVSYAYSGGADNYLVTPPLNPVAGEVLQFYLASQKYPGTTVTIEVSEGSNTDAADFTTVLATYQSDVDITNQWGEAKEFSLSAYAGKQIYVAFHVVDNNGGNIYLDDVSIIAPVSCAKPMDFAATATPDGTIMTWSGEEGSQYQCCIVPAGEEAAGWKLLETDVFTYTATGLTEGNAYDAYVRTYCSETEQSTEVKQSFTPACNAPANIELSELTHNTATFSWNEVAGVSKYQFVCLRTDSTPDWENVEANDVLTVTIDTLQPSTNYNFYLRSYFSADKQSEAVKTAFTTNCIAETLPYNETFDASATLPVCWEVNNVTNANWKMYTYGDEGKSGNCVQFSGKNGSTATLKTPAVELSEKALLKFYWKNSSAISVSLQISTNGGSTKTEISTDLSSAHSTLTEKTIDLSPYEGETVTLYFVASNVASSNRLIYLDELAVVAKPCTMPKQLKASATSAGAVVTWAAGGDEEQWNLRYRATGSDEWKEVTALTTPSDTLSGLLAVTEYEVQVQAACSADKQSEWTASAVFTPQCPQPTSVAAKAIAYDRAIVTWSGTESLFNLEYRIKDADEWMVIDSIEAKSYRLTDLEAATTYQVRIQTACEGEYSKTVSFTTLCAPLAPETVPYVETFDSIADGKLPLCWERISENEYPQVVAGTAAWGEEGSCLWFNGEGEQIAVLPVFDINLREQLLMFYYKTLSASLQVGYMTELSADAFVPLATLDAVSAYGSAPYVLSLSNVEGMVYLAIRYYDATSAYARAQIDNITLSDTAPTAIGVINGEKATGRKLIENGSLILEYNGMRFDATGRKQ